MPTLALPRLWSVSGHFGATWLPRMTSERAKSASRAPLGATSVLQSGTRSHHRAAVALESAARDHLGTASALNNAAQARCRATKACKSMAQACTTAGKTARSSFLAALRSNVLLEVCVFASAFFSCCRFRHCVCMCLLCRRVSFSFLLFCVSSVFVSVSLFTCAVVCAFACVFR